MQDIVIIGAGGFAREVAWLIEQKKEEWNILGFIANEAEKEIGNYRVIGDDKWLLNRKEQIGIVCAIGDSKLRKTVMERYIGRENFSFPNIIADGVRIEHSVKIGRGAIICSGSAITVDIKIGDFFICNLNNTIGHDCIIGDYVTINPGVNVSGNVRIGDMSNIGTGSKIIQGITIGSNVISGAGAVIIHNISDNCTVVGVPAKKIK